MLCHTEYAEQKKRLLESSLLNLMKQQQYQDITVTDICREADIPRRTFYHYFEGKETVLDSVVNNLMQQCFLDIMLDFRLGPEKLKSSFLKIFRYWDGENRRKLDILIQSGLEARLMAWSSRWIREERIGMLLDSELDPKHVEIILMVGATSFFALLFHWSQGGYRESAEEMADYAVWVLPQALVHM